LSGLEDAGQAERPLRLVSADVARLISLKRLGRWFGKTCGKLSCWHTRKAVMGLERVLRWTLVSIAIAGLVLGIAARANGRPDVADFCFTFATIPVIAGLAVSMARDLLAGRLGVDAIALVSMSAAIALARPPQTHVGPRQRVALNAVGLLFYAPTLCAPVEEPGGADPDPLPQGHLDRRL